MKTINVFIGKSRSGDPVREELLVDPVGDRFRVLASPGLVLGLAKGDEIRFYPDSGLFDLVSRGGNIAIQIFLTQAAAASVDRLKKSMEQLDATMDRLNEAQVVFSVHISKGFSAIEKIANEFAEQNPGTEWFYGNVYADDGVTPLDWWR